MIAFSGLTRQTRDYWVYVQVNESSWGGRFGKDGMDSIGCLMENIRNNPIEEEELSFPVRVERYELRDEGPAPGTLARGPGRRPRDALPRRGLGDLGGRAPVRPAEGHLRRATTAGPRGPR